MRASGSPRLHFLQKKVLELSMMLGVKIKIKANTKLRRFVSTNIANALMLLKEIASKNVLQR